jgi:GNAT superfamily N-acetyltransferase
MKFQRPLAAAVSVPACDLDVRVVAAESAAAFGQVVCEGFGLQAQVAPWVAQLPGRAGWTCVMALDGALPVAAGAAFVKGRHAWLGFGTTLASHRRHGAQSALLARRLQEAAAQGAQVAVTETGQRLPDKPDNSYRNILKAGFVEAYLRPNYLSP